MTTCARCSRPLRNPVLLSGVAFGSKCAQAVAGAKPKRKKRSVESHAVVVDPSQRDLFVEEAA